ncbi:tRNA guanosine(34) transglycosylase Tgt [Longibacter salinarum]|uniref:Queuine tRNA-ribosyltransferase n=1 Tax=Longibacter salinarum TaxID=1850348 RepID=A0A2A8CVN7_9BACT|nr:tRNA guanosine(34) transglycosylase Tgt [Longibacter salinarum]PEN12775.1 tRNA guanosine(34) transglycosylase Tgt [Longibacter salinarum]
MQFHLDYTDAATDARVGRIVTDHGVIETPTFMPVGTLGSVKAVEPRELSRDIDADIILGNTYHLFLRPGTDVLETAGGLHQFMNWDGPILTDSGGFQVFSLGHRATLSEEGVEFQNHIDGDKHLFTPETVIDIQRSIGSDIMMVLDECPAADVTKQYARTSNELTLRWAERCKKHFDATDPLYGHEQALFAIVQGVVYPEVRRESARALVDMDFPGYAIGGLSVGETHEEMYDMVEVVAPLLPTDKPRYLMGVGTPENLLENVARGIDTFDCVMPTRNARNGTIFTTQGRINIKNAQFTQDHTPIDPGLENPVSQNFTKSYLRHLQKTGEILGLQLASIQNLAFYLWLMKTAREKIASGDFKSWKDDIIPQITHRW